MLGSVGAPELCWALSGQGTAGCGLHPCSRLIPLRESHQHRRLLVLTYGCG